MRTVPRREEGLPQAHGLVPVALRGVRVAGEKHGDGIVRGVLHHRVEERLRAKRVTGTQSKERLGRPLGLREGRRAEVEAEKRRSRLQLTGPDSRERGVSRFAVPGGRRHQGRMEGIVRRRDTIEKLRGDLQLTLHEQVPSHPGKPWHALPRPRRHG